jgi:hypothetical protein
MHVTVIVRVRVLHTRENSRLAVRFAAPMCGHAVLALASMTFQQVQARSMAECNRIAVLTVKPLPSLIIMFENHANPAVVRSVVTTMLFLLPASPAKLAVLSKDAQQAFRQRKSHTNALVLVSIMLR